MTLLQTLSGILRGTGSGTGSSASTTADTQSQLDALQNEIAQTQRINQLSNVAIANPTVSNASITSGSGSFSNVSADTLNAGQANISNLTVTGTINAPGLSASSTSFSDFTSTNATTTNLSAAHAVFTNATTTRLFSDDLLASFATATALSASYASLASVIADDATITSATSSTLHAGAFTAERATTTNLAAASAAFTNATSTSLFASLFHAATGVIDSLTGATLTYDRGTFTDLTAGNATTTNATTTHLAITNVPNTLLKTDANGSVVPAVAGTDYLNSLQGAASSTALADDNTFTGTNTFTKTIAGSISGNAGTVTNGVYTTTFSGLFNTNLAGKSTTNLAEGSNLYFTPTRATANFVSNLAGTTSVASITTLPHLSLAYSQLTGTPTIPTNNNQLTNGAGYLTSLSGAASSTLLANNNTFSGNDTFTKPVAVGSGTGTSTFAGGVAVAGSIVPAASNTYSLGSAADPWKDFYVGDASIYVNGQEVLHTDPSDNVNVSADTNQDLILQTSGSGDVQLNPTGTGVVYLKGDIMLTGGKSISTSDLSALSIPNGIATGHLTIADNAISATNLNGGISLSPAGSGGVYVTSGNLGVGTTSPSHTLSVAGNALIQGLMTAAAAAFSGTITASNLSGTNTGDQTSVSGNAGTATKLATPRTIAGVSFDGSANISLNNNAITNGAGYTTNTGTVTSVALSGGTTGLTVSGSPITTSGTITLAGTLGVANGGTGASTLTGILKGNGTSAFTAATLGTDYINSSSINTSAKLAAILGDETGTGNAVFSASPTLSGTMTAAAANFSGHVGIGTTTPAALLSVQGSGAAIAAYTSGTTDTAIVAARSFDYHTTYASANLIYNGATVTGTTAGISNANLGDLEFLNTANALINTNNLSPLIFATANAERMRITTAGNVGIGTVSPNRLLDILNTTANPQERISYDATRYTELQTDAAGDFLVAPTSGIAELTNSNLYICASGVCATPTTPLSGTGNLSVAGRLVAGSLEESCPAGYIWVPGEAKQGTLPGFCTMKYVASNSAGKPVSVASGAPWVSISQTSAIAECQSVGPGYHLMSDQEWMTIADEVAALPINDIDAAAGMQLANGHSDNTPANALTAGDAGADPAISGCNLMAPLSDSTNAYASGSCELRGNGSDGSTDADKGYYGTGNDFAEAYSAGASNKSQLRTKVLPDGAVIWDFGGNVWQWTDATIWSASLKGAASSTVSEMPDAGNWTASAWEQYASITNYKGLNYIRPDITTWTSANGIGEIYLPADSGATRAFIRGGYWDAGADDGAFALTLNNAPSNTYTGFGFRCSR